MAPFHLSLFLMVSTISYGSTAKTCTLTTVDPAQLKTQFPDAASVQCTDAIRSKKVEFYEEFDETFENCKTDCDNEDDCRVALGQNNGPDITCVLFTAVCTELACTNCIDQIDHAAVCADTPAPTQPSSTTGQGDGDDNSSGHVTASVSTALLLMTSALLTRWLTEI